MKICPKCGRTDHEPGAKFCHKDGTPLVNNDNPEPPKPRKNPANDTDVIVKPPKLSKRKTNLRFERAESFHEGLAMVEVGGKIGFIDKTGNIVIRPIFTNCSAIYYRTMSYHGFYEGLAAVSVGLGEDIRYGCIDHSGNWVIQPEFGCIYPFVEGLAQYQNGNGLGFIDKKGNIVIQPICFDLTYFSEGLAPVRDGGRFIFIDKTGRTIIDRTKNRIFNLDDGLLARRATLSDAGSFCEGLARVKCSEKTGYIDKSGQFYRVKANNVGDFSEGLADFVVNNYTQCGYIDKNFNIVIQPRFDSADNFHEGLAKVRMNNKFGFINKTGEIIIPCQFDDASPFNEGLAAIKIDKKWGYINSSGTVVIQPRFRWGKEFSEGLAAVQENNQWGFIDKSGNYIF